VNVVQEKVFGIGMFKTGLTSLGLALEQLGYRFSADEWYHGKIEDDPWDLYRQFPNNQLRLVMERADEYDAHVDYPWMFLFREMDQAFGGARFIYTVRDPERLATSNQTHRRRKGTPEAGVPSRRRIIQRYLEHQRLVLHYFAGRSNLLVVSWEAGAGWKELCGFLKKEKPESTFPWANRSCASLPAPRADRKLE
jgi:Sulfotransferase domain